MVIDDDPAAREVITRFLAKEGFSPVSASTGKQGLRLAKELRPAVITLDALMPGMDGWTVLAALKADPETAEIPVVMLSILDNQDLGFALGASDYLTKPIDSDRLARVLIKYAGHMTSGRVLIVEDDSDTRETLSRRLQEMGWTVSEANNGRMALEEVRKQRPELILLDLMMPEMDGFEFAEELRRSVAWREIPIVVVSAKDISQEDQRRLNRQVAKILPKGVSSCEELLLDLDNEWPLASGQTETERETKKMPRILVVEDNEMNRDMLSRRLQRREYEVLLALDGRQGIAMAQSESPDLILLDLSLPEIDGWEATRCLKADPATRDIPVIALTAHAMARDREKAFEAGCDDYDTKPVDFRRLLRKIETLLSEAAPA